MNHVRERSGPTRRASARGILLRATATTAVASLAVFGGVTAAHAAPGDDSNATGTFLGGSLLDLIDLSSIVNLEGAAATNDGTIEPDVTDYNTIDLTALGLVNVSIPGGVQLPIDFADIGVLGQYASALPDASSVGASGLIGADGAVGTGVVPAPGVVPGSLNVNLSSAVQALAGSVAAELVDELATVDLTLGAVGANATQAAPDPATGDYTIADGQLVIGSDTVAGLVGAVNTGVGGIQTTLDELQADLNETLEDLLGIVGGLVDVGVTVDTTSLTDAVSGLLTTPLTDPAYPGVSIDLSTGQIIVDLDAIQPLNGLGVGEEILSGTTIAAIENAVFALIEGLTTQIDEALTAAISGLAITGGASVTLPFVGTIPILTIDTTIGDLLDGDTSGIELLGIALTIPGLLDDVIADILAPLDGLIGQVTDLTQALLVPVNALLLPALDEILPLLVSLTANNQSLTPDGVFTETALRLTVLPTISGVTLDLASASVGPNALDDNADVTIDTPFDGEEFVVPGEDDTDTVTVSGTGEPGANVTVSVTDQADQTVPVDGDGNWTADFPDLPVGDYVATAVQDVDETTASVDFAVVAADDVEITNPVDGEIITVPAPGDTADVDIDGTGEPGSEITVVVDGQTLTDTVAPDGTWGVTALDLEIGEYDATATQDFDGSTDEVSFAVAESADVVITAPADGEEFVVDDSDDTTTVVVEGTGDPGAEITVQLTGQTPQVVEVEGDGSWSAEFPDLEVGGYTATATQDSDGTSDTVSFTIVAATDVVITAPEDGEILLVDEPGDTRDVVVAGTGQPGAEVVVDVDGEELTTEVDGDGNWSVEFEGLPEGEYTATASQDDGSSDSVDFSIAAAADVLITSPEPGEEFEVPGPDDVTTVPVTGTAQPNANVTVTLPGVGTQVVPVDGDGNWDTEFVDVPVGDYTLTATQDADPSSDTVDFAVVETADVEIISPEDGQVILVPDSGDTTEVEVTGTGDPGAEITVTGDGLETQVTEVDEDGNWSVVIPDVPEGAHVITATQDTDESSSSVEISVEAADDVVITSPTDGEQISAGTEDSTSVDVQGTGQPGATVTVDLEGTEQTTTVGEDGTWTTTFLGVPIGDHTATATQDVDGSTASVSFSVVAGPDTSQARATVTQTRIVRGPGATQTVLVSGMQPGESVSATVRSTPFDLPAVTADASGNATLTFAVGSDFELGAHRVDVRGSITGEIPDERETTAFTVVAPAAAGNNGGGLAATGSTMDAMLFTGAGLALLLAGAVVWMLRRRRTAD